MTHSTPLSGISGKLLIIILLALGLLVPTILIASFMAEREESREEVLADIYGKWAAPQVLAGPFLLMDGGKGTSVQILPEQLHISGTVQPDIRHRSIYEAVVYATQLELTGRFELPAEVSEATRFCLGLSDMRGIQSELHVKLGDQRLPLEPGMPACDVAETGMYCYLPAESRQGTIEFSLSVSFRGSERLRFLPLGARTEAKISSTWEAPSFQGASLPGVSQVNDQGFEAHWTVLHLNRNYPQILRWETRPGKYAQQIRESAFGVDLVMTADLYQKCSRTVKYALMFIVLMFAAFFFSELISRRRLHPVQYLFVGLAIVLFYILQLSIAEHLGFDSAYLIAAGAITMLIAGYAKSILSSARMALAVCALMAMQYGFLYIVLQLEHYSLLMGSAVLFLVLAASMYFTRRIDWYALDGRKGKPKAEE